MSFMFEYKKMYRKIISLPSSKYVIKRDGTLWAKGMWGEKIKDIQ